MSQIIAKIQEIHPLEWLIWVSIIAPIIGGMIEYRLTKPFHTTNDTLTKN